MLNCLHMSCDSSFMPISSVDWVVYLHCRHQRYIGKTKHAVFHSHKTGRKRVVVSTEENVIASLDLRTGDICKYCHLCTSYAKFYICLVCACRGNFVVSTFQWCKFDVVYFK